MSQRRKHEQPWEDRKVELDPKAILQFAREERADREERFDKLIEDLTDRLARNQRRLNELRRKR